MKLKDKAVILTGATGGMGSAMAELFIKEGASLILSGRDSSRGIKLQEKLCAMGGRAVFVPGNIAEATTNENLVVQAIAQFGKVDIVIANAGQLGLGSVTSLASKDWHDALNTNLTSVYYLCHYAIPEMLKQGKGVILANSSIAAFKSFPNHAAYCASKAGLVALVKQMALDYGPVIRANAICPGPVDTPMIWDSAKAFKNPEGVVEQTVKRTPLKRLGRPEDIAALALFLISDEASWITGSAYAIDGGILGS